MEPKLVLDFAPTYVVPIISFFFGVFIADRIGLHASLERRRVYFMSIPVGLVTTGILISSTSVLVEGTAKHGHMDSVAQYLTFCGTIMFHGTAVPKLFEAFRTRLIHSSGTDSD